ncbi:chlorophyll a/b-binding protein domain-containing protein [Pavlovales sp. CCMP2436]|nr:chlorophyll a/b-binding protein domain-containing protein [Pavlovales sp. CCMP2436]|mmetsp:Transcript_14961/g.37964  ORF Transcript_14961/g.37964 Transcript_14961/m.37964 type:complete len:202 (-) Transcript_14961:194-799(-)
MLSTVVFAAVSFNGLAPVSRAGARSAVSMAAKPKAAKAASAYDNELGADVETNGFWDPAGFTKKNDFAKLRLAELKHGRAAMLAVTGFVVQEFYRWPNSAGLFQAANPLDALSPENAPSLGFAQIFLVAGIIEFRSAAYPGRTIGDIGFDPLGLSKDGIPENYALAEIKNGRLAMVAFLAFVVQTSIAGKGIIESTFDVFA